MARHPPKLTDKIREGIIVRFASCYSVEEVRAWLKEEHQVDLAGPALSYYNANNPGGRAGLSPKWREIFDRTRTDYLEGVTAVPIAHKAHRLRLLDDALNRLMTEVRTGKRPNIVLMTEMRAILEQAAKEMGEAFTNRRILDIDARGNLAKLLGINPDQLPEGDGGDDQP